MVDFNKIKKTLLEEKERLTEDVLQKKELQKSGSDELSQYDNHPADTASELTERTTVAAIDAKNQEKLREIEAALEAIEEGTYGVCKECGVEIPYERLEIVPETLYCIEHVPKKQSPGPRPVEEEVIDEMHKIERDHINSFSEVASHGTSETPSDFAGKKTHYAKFYNDEDMNHIDD